jgi:uncharacterized glyoxalase superfamily protein PhnB
MARIVPYLLHEDVAGMLAWPDMDDVDAGCNRGRVVGAEIREKSTDRPYGDRRHSAVDPEAHQWFFAQHLDDVPPEAWGATPAPAA